MTAMYNIDNERARKELDKMLRFQLATALKWWIDSKMDEISIRLNGAKAGRVGGKSLDYYKGYEQALKDFRRRLDIMQEYGIEFDK